MHLSPTQFYGHADVLMQCLLHQLMEGVQGFTQSHWMPSLVKYLLCIIPLDDGVGCKKNNGKSTILVGMCRYETKGAS
jgi:hypothetical protein